MAEPWIAPLEAGDPEAAWTIFLERYRRLVFGAIRHYARDYDDVMDVFARVCEALREDDLRKLRDYARQPTHRARFSTWLVTVVRHITIDFFRARDGRRRLSVIAERLPPLQRRIFEQVFLLRHSHLEAFELIRTGGESGLSFREFQAELRATYRAVADGRRGGLLRELGGPVPPEPEPDASSPEESDERRRLIARALDALNPEDRLAIQLFVIDELPAATVAGILGAPNAKAVYNQVYRALAVARTRLEQSGVSRGDL